MHTVIFKYDMYLNEITISLFMSLIKYLSWFSILALLKFSHSTFYFKVYILNYNLMFFHICNSILLIITIFRYTNYYSVSIRNHIYLNPFAF